MGGGGACKYHVIQFLEAPYKGIAEYVCVPTSWVQWREAGVPIVNVSYPVEEPSLTEQRVKNRKRKLDSWKSFLSVVRFNSDNYENAKIYIQQEINNSKENKRDSYVDAKNIQDRTNKSEKKSGDHTPLSATANEKTSISAQNATSTATIDNDANVVSRIEALGWCVSSKSADTITLKRKAQSAPDKEKHKKRRRVNEPDESDNQTAGPSSKALDCSSKNYLSPTPDDCDEALYTQEKPVEKFNESNTEMRQTTNQNSSKTTYSLDPTTISQIATSPAFAKWTMLMQKLQEVFDNSMFKDIINKLLNNDNDGSAPQNNDPIESVSNDTTVEAPKLNKEKTKEKPVEKKDTDDDDDGKDQPPKKKSSTKRIKKAVLPSKEANHSEKSDSDDSEDDLQTPKKTNSTKRIKKAILPPVNDVNHSEMSGFDDDDKDQPVKKKSFPTRIKKINLRVAYDDRSESELELEDDEELPPEYDANDTRWTLKYREPAPGLVELIPDTGVYVANLTSNPLKFATPNPLALAIKLLNAIFTKKALSICTLTDIRAKAPHRRGGTIVRPVLDEHALSVLINYVTDRANRVDKPKVGIRRILKSMRNSMQDIRKTYNWNLEYK